MAIYIERMIQKIAPGKWGALEVLDQHFNAVESKLGFPPKRRMRAILGGQSVDTLVVEREWESLAAFEAATMKRMGDPANAALDAESIGVIESLVWEIYMVLP